MKIEDFIETYSNDFMFVFFGKERPSDKTSFTKLSEFLFEPRYTVNSLKFKKVG